MPPKPSAQNRVKDFESSIIAAISPYDSNDLSFLRVALENVLVIVVAAEPKCSLLPTQTNLQPTAHSLDAPSSVPKQKPKPPAIQKHKHGTYGWVTLTDAEYDRLLKDFGETTLTHYINGVDEKVEINQNKHKYKNFNVVIRKAIREKWCPMTVQPSTLYLPNTPKSPTHYIATNGATPPTDDPYQDIFFQKMMEE